MVEPKGHFRFCALALVLFLLSVSRCTAIQFGKEGLHNIFDEFTSTLKRDYVNNATEYELRFKIFKDNIEQADLLNKEHVLTSRPVFGVTKFSDLSHNEFKAMYLSSYKPKLPVYNNHTHQEHESMSRLAKELGLPQKVDWRSKGVLTPIKNQETCGACWAFSVVETMEAMHVIQFNSSTKSLSVQELIDCDNGNNGCKGGDICQAATYASMHGIIQESHYPLTDETGKCKPFSASLPQVRTTNQTCKQYIGKETKLLAALVEGPVSIAVDATTWHSYVGGIIRFHCSSYINHAVSLVGYDLTGEVPFYIVRNSWGADFGDHGYLYVKIGENLCGIATEISQMTVTKLS